MLLREQRFYEAIAATERIIATANGESDRPDLLNGVMMTRLQLKALLDPGPTLITECEALADRCEQTATDASALVELTTLRTELGLLLDDPADQRIDGVVGRLLRLSDRTAQHPNQRSIAHELLGICELLTTRGHPREGLLLARETRARLDSSHEDEDRRTVATAQLWTVIATNFAGPVEPASAGGETPQATSVTDLFSALRDQSDEELRKTDPGLIELDRCCALGAPAADAAAALVEEFASRDGWDQAELVIRLVQLTILDHLGRTDQADHASAQLISQLETSTNADLRALVPRLRAELS